MSDTPSNSEKEKQILAERAAQFAAEQIDQTALVEHAFFVFNVGKDQKYAVDFAAIERVIPHQTVRSIPGVNPLFSGLIYYNTEFWPVINLQVLFDCKEPSFEKHFILLHDEPYRYALAIGSVIGQIKYNSSQDLITLSKKKASQHAYLLGIFQTDIAVIDISTILNLVRSTPVI